MKKAVEGVLRRSRSLAYSALASDAGNFIPPVRYARKAAGFVNDLLGRPLASEAELDRRSSEVDRLESLADKARSGQVATAPKEAAPVMLYVTDQFMRERKRLEDILKGRGIPYQVLDVTDDESTRSWALTKAQATGFRCCLWPVSRWEASSKCCPLMPQAVCYSASTASRQGVCRGTSLALPGYKPANHPRSVEPSRSQPGYRASGRCDRATAWVCSPFVDHLRATGLVPSGRLFDVLSVDADQKRVKVRVGEHDHLLDYGQVQNLLREVARNARREAVARKPDQRG